MVNIWVLSKTNNNNAYSRLIESVDVSDMKAMFDFWNTKYYWQFVN